LPDEIFGEIKPGAASRIVPTPSASSGQALREEREEWGTRGIVASAIHVIRLTPLFPRL
jgi:hypothetical protein